MVMGINLEKQMDFIWQKTIERHAQLEQPGVVGCSKQRAYANEIVRWVGNQTSIGFIRHSECPDVWIVADNKKSDDWLCKSLLSDLFIFRE